MIWNINQDKFAFKLVKRDYHITKPGILSLSSSNLDLLGILTPRVLEPQPIIEELRKLMISSDKQFPIPTKLEARYIIWKNEMINMVLKITLMLG